MGNSISSRPLDGAIYEALVNENEDLAVRTIQEYLDQDRKVPLNIAITGECGSGKSTFVNAIRGLRNDEEGAAPTGSVETTLEVKSYEHPSSPNVKFWDLPGIGTTSFPAAKYLKLVKFKRFDFFIIISADRFRENDVKLAKEIQRMKKNFYFVRSKIDHNMMDEKRSQKTFDEQRILEEIRENCKKSLEKLGLESPQVYLISSLELHRYDFPLLEETLERALPEHKRNAFLLAMPIVSMELIKKKRKFFQSQIKYIATSSAAVAAIPLPGLFIAVDLVLLAAVITRYVFSFGLDIQSLHRIANYMDVPYDTLKKIITSPLAAAALTPDLLLRILADFGSTAALLVAEEGSRFIPVLGIPAAMILSFTITFRSLNMILNMLSEDAERILNEAMKLRQD